MKRRLTIAAAAAALALQAAPAMAQTCADDPDECPPSGGALAVLLIYVPAPLKLTIASVGLYVNSYFR